MQVTNGLLSSGTQHLARVSRRASSKNSLMQTVVLVTAQNLSSVKTISSRGLCRGIRQPAGGHMRRLMCDFADTIYSSLPPIHQLMFHQQTTVAFFRLRLHTYRLT